ncbi:MAG: hypothetical protein U9P50_00985 [Patescibacteria group bacterium]|nr:hypothetical protein [Patescibacteria group bacterium]
MENIDFLNIQQIYAWIYGLIGFLIHYLNPATLFDLYHKYWAELMFIATIISLVCIVCFWYLYQKIQVVKEKDREVFDTVISPFADMDEKGSKNERWERILNYMESESQSEWKLAILDADVILEKMLIKSGYHGEGVGEKLKGIERSDFLTLDKAWEAHKIRNSIAHGGSDIILTKRTAKKAIDLYRQVFEEFEYI